jgi:geranylgeranyl reductase family protein
MMAGIRHDIGVIGAGPAGATAAYCLARSGLDVCLVDKQSFPRPKLCAGLLTWKTIRLLGSVFGTSVNTLTRMGIVKQRCKDYRIYARGSELHRGSLDFPFYLVDRTRYDLLWLEKAIAAGAGVMTGIAATAVDPNAGRVQLSDGNQLHCRMIIGADGAWSKIRGTVFNASKDIRRWRRQMAMTVEKHCPPQRGRPCVALHFGYVPWGYAWAFPSGDRQIVGMACLHRKKDRSFTEGFRNFMASIDLSEEAMPPWQGHPLPFGNFLKTPAKGRVLLVGDACGLADPLLGEGIYYAHRSGQIAAAAIRRSDLHHAAAASFYRRALGTGIIRELCWIKLYRNLLFAGGGRRKFRGLNLFLRLFPKRLEATIHGNISFRRLLWPW